jgi:TATA-box binding protein (TBP) (component of TFIID and TFIIIB)
MDNINTKIKISTITLSTKLPVCQLNLTNIGKYLDIDDIIIGLKYNYADLSIMKGKYSTTVYKKAKVKDSEKINKKLFYNQISMIVHNSGNDVNVKLFGNGSLHLTGCKSINEGIVITRLVYEKLKTLVGKTDTILLTKDANNILLDRDNLIYGYNTKQIIGHCRGIDSTKYIINKKDFCIDHKTGMFITEKMETQRRHFIHNLDGEQIGHTRIELLKNRHKFYKNNTNVFFDRENCLIYHNNETIIGKIVYEIEEDKLTNISSVNDIVEIEYDCNPFFDKDYHLSISESVDNHLSISESVDNHLSISESVDNHLSISESVEKLKSLIDLNVNCMNVYFTIDYKINRQRFYERLIDMNYICKYKPESYSGIKMLYKIPLQEKTNLKPGLCPCTNKCTCINVTFLIFQSGNVIATGFKTNEQIQVVTDNFLKLCHDVKDSIKKRLFFE